jgi:hypothetical protein
VIFAFSTSASARRDSDMKFVNSPAASTNGFSSLSGLATGPMASLTLLYTSTGSGGGAAGSAGAGLGAFSRIIENISAINTIGSFGSFL